MESFLNSYCSCETDNRAEHVIQAHANDILSNVLQPVFKQHALIHPTLNRKPQTRYGDTDTGLDQNQQWKEGNFLDILKWIVDTSSSEQLQQNLHLLIPPVLIVLDDFDVGCKARGVKMLHTMIRKLEPAYISKFGLDNVFLESLFKCLLYLSADRDEPLLKVTYPCLMDLIATKKEGRARSDLYERVLREGIIAGFTYAGQKILFLPILLEPVPRLYEELGAIGVQYLKTLVPALCTSMSMTSANNPDIRNINLLSAEALQAVIRKCWPRIPNYRGQIMQAIAKSWKHYYSEKDDDACDILRQLYKVFEAACGGKEKADKEALLSYDVATFKPLFASS